MQFDCGTRIVRVISRAGSPCHLSKLHQYLYRATGDHDLRYNVSLSDFSDAGISRCAHCLT